MEEKKQSRPRDERGRFVSREAEHEITDKKVTRVVNRIADNGEPTEEEVHNQDIFVSFVQNALGIIVALFVIILILAVFCGCSPTEKAVYIPVVKTVEVQTMVRDTIVETELIEYYSERETRDTASYLSNPFAYSQATIIGGTLNHTLGIHPGATVTQTFPVTERIVTITDSVPYPVEIVKTEYIERKPPPIEHTLMWAGAIAIIAAAAWAALTLKRHFA